MAEDAKTSRGKALFKSLAEIVTFTITIVGATTAYLNWRKDKLDARLKEIDVVYKQASEPGGFFELARKYAAADFEFKDHYLGNLQFKDVQTCTDVGKFFAFFNRICYKRELGLFTEEDFAMFVGDIDAVLALPFTQRYFSDLVQVNPRTKRSTFPYMPLLRRGAAEGVWDGYVKLKEELERREEK